MSETPMLAQYRRIKAEHRDAILFFRLGDFYEMFFDDAQAGSRILGLTLTQRQGMPMCGVPHHAAHQYVGRLLKAGRKVAICEQTTPPGKKGLVEREVVEVLSPGTVFDEDFLEPVGDNNLTAIGAVRGNLVLGWIEASTGRFVLGAFPHWDRAVLLRELGRLEPRELLVQESLLEERLELQEIAANRNVLINRLADWAFDVEHGARVLSEHFRVQNLRGFGFGGDEPELACAGVLVDYLNDTARRRLNHVWNVSRLEPDGTVLIDEATQRNLELVRNQRDSGTEYSLLRVIDDTVTAMGARRLKRRVVAPLRDRTAIEAELDRVDYLYRRQETLARVRTALNGVYDLERLLGRVGVRKAHPKDLGAIGRSLEGFAAIVDLLRESPLDAARHLSDAIATCARVSQRIRETIADDPPVALADGGVIRPGFDTDLDGMRSVRDHGRELLDGHLDDLRRRTGIRTLKLRYNRVLGHFWEVPASQAGQVPDDFIRRQSLANAERFTTRRLSDLEVQINNAGDEAIRREQEVYSALLDELTPMLPDLARAAAYLADVDATQGLARVATDRGYSRPTMKDEPVLDLIECRHPVVEAYQSAGEFVPNDLHIGGRAQPFVMITGPNMAGKSTVLRQAALITIMAHIGSFVPAAQAEIGVTDRVFCRVGAADNLARGESTFLVEMNEAALILRTATGRSLIVMDELGRGTSTHDGLSIAQAIAEYLVSRVGARTLFATHYHELTAIDHPAIVNRSLRVDHAHGKIVFLRTLVEGAAERSYGIDVARMAGLPDPVVERARDLLTRYEEHAAGSPQQLGSPPAVEKSTRDMSLFSAEELVVDQLRAVDPNGLSARAALDLVYRLVDQLQTDQGEQDKRRHRHEPGER